MKTIIITGAAGGIGRATALRFASDLRQDAQIVLGDRDAGPLEELARELREFGAKASMSAGDLAEQETAGNLVAEAIASFGTLDIIVSNAGITRRGGLEQQTVDAWDEVMNVNARAFWLLAKAGFGPLKASRGALVAVASIAGVEPNPRTGFYSASKAALLSLVAQLGLEWAPLGIRVNAVSPGATMTPLVAGSYKSADLKQRREQFIPLRRFAEPEEIAGAIAFLSGSGARFWQGQNLVVDGGLVPSVLAHSLPPIGRKDQ